jgi:FkbM family methyltransferase
MPPDTSKKYRFYQGLKLAIDYFRAFSVPVGAWVIASILIAKLLRRPLIHVRVPGTRRIVRLRNNWSDIRTYNQVFIHREYDFSRFPQAAQLSLSPLPGESNGIPTKIIDCGANIGCSVIWFALQFPGANIVAIEPDAENFELLKQNVVGLGSVCLMRAALWSSVTSVVIANPEADPWAFRTEALVGGGNENTAAVDTVTLDDLLTHDTEDTRLIVKIDIEGAEREVFSKNISWLEAVDLLIIELHDWLYPGEGNGRTFFSAVASKQMDYMWRGENLLCFQMKKTDKNHSGVGYGFLAQNEAAGDPVNPALNTST